MRGRQLKAIVLGLLKQTDFRASLEMLTQLPAKQVVNPLFASFCNSDERVRHRGVTAMGVVVAELAKTDREAARIIMRRHMWTLNDESGGIGWGAPEAMAEIMVRDERMALEYSLMLVSYLDEDGNFLEYEVLQRGLLWGLARLASARWGLLRHAGPLLEKYLDSRDATVRGFGALNIGLLNVGPAEPKLRSMLGDRAPVRYYWDDMLTETSAGDLVREALGRLEGT
ncbi:DVU0298 family protein [Thermodesulfobacteriota bacterium]